jgi:hypothetical protein
MACSEPVKRSCKVIEKLRREYLHACEELEIGRGELQILEILHDLSEPGSEQEAARRW